MGGIGALFSDEMRHAKIRQAQSLLQLLKKFDWLTRQQLSITNLTSAKLSFSSSLSGCREKNDAFKFRLLVNFEKTRQNQAGGDTAQITDFAQTRHKCWKMVFVF